MSDPLNSQVDQDGGLNSSDTQNWDGRDWADPKTTNLARLMAFVILPSVFVVIAVFAVYWGLTHQQKPGASILGSKPVAVASVPAATDKDAQIAQLQTQILNLQTQLAHPAATNPAAPPAPVYTADPAALAQLSARVDRLEANQRTLARAAAVANAASALRQASIGAAPFATELALVEPDLDNPHLIDPLRPYAEKGIPTEVALAVAFPHVAARANITAKAGTDDDSLLARAKHVLFSFVSVRRMDNINGQGVDSTLLRAETRLNQGDLNGAVTYLGTLPEPAQKAIKPWLDQAHARLLVDDITTRISQVALNRLSQVQAQSVTANGGAL